MNEEKTDIEVQTGINDFWGNYSPWFRIDNQTFELRECEGSEDETSEVRALWYEKQLRIAFGKIQKQIIEAKIEELESFIDCGFGLTDKASIYLNYRITELKKQLNND